MQHLKVTQQDSVPSSFQKCYILKQLTCFCLFFLEQEGNFVAENAWSVLLQSLRHCNATLSLLIFIKKKLIIILVQGHFN